MEFIVDCTGPAVEPAVLSPILVWKKEKENVMSAGGDCSFSCEPLLLPCATDGTRTHTMLVIDKIKEGGKEKKRRQAVLGDECPHFFLKHCRPPSMLYYHRNAEHRSVRTVP